MGVVARGVDVLFCETAQRRLEVLVLFCGEGFLGFGGGLLVEQEKRRERGRWMGLSCKVGGWGFFSFGGRGLSGLGIGDHSFLLPISFLLLSS